MNEATEQMRERTKALAVRIVRLYRALPDSRDGQVIGMQLLRSGTSVGANYRAVCRARSKKDFVSKIGVVLEEADETGFWLELLAGTGIMPETRLKAILQEARELTAIFTATQRTSRSQ